MLSWTSGSAVLGGGRCGYLAYPRAELRSIVSPVRFRDVADEVMQREENRQECRVGRRKDASGLDPYPLPPSACVVSVCTLLSIVKAPLSLPFDSEEICSGSKIDPVRYYSE